MAGISYISKVLRHASFDRLNEVVNEVHKRTNMRKLSILKDIIHCARKFGAGYYDYIIFHFYELNEEERATHITRLKNKKFLEHVNDPSYSHFFDNKNEFDVLFAKFLKRGYVDAYNASKEEIIEYFNSREKIFAKVLNLDCGRGAEILKKQDFKDGEEFYKYVKEKNFAVLEDVVENHPDINDIYPYAVNTMRMITLIDDDGKPHLFYAAQKFGDGGRFVDVRGMHAPVDTETGIVKYPFHSGETTSDIFYHEHPYTHKKIDNFKVPLFQEAKEMMLEAAMVVPQVRYVGWDVAISPDGPLIIEGNDYGAYEYMQLPGQKEGNIGMLPKWKELVPSFEC